MSQLCNIFSKFQDAGKDEKSHLKGFPIKEKIGPLFSRISPVLKRKSSAQSPSKETPSEATGMEGAYNHQDTRSGPKRDPSVEEVNLLCSSLDSASPPAADESAITSQDANSCAQCKTFLADIDQIQEGKVQLEKQLAKSREESERLSDLIKDMEHKWTEVAKDYEKQVKLFNC